MPRLRLVKVLVQPVFVLDDGERLDEMVAEAVIVPAAEWPTYATTSFEASFEALREQIEGPPPAPALVAPNRAARRAKPKP